MLEKLSPRLRLIKERENKVSPGPTLHIVVQNGRNFRELPAYKALLDARTVAPIIRYDDELPEKTYEEEPWID